MVILLEFQNRRIWLLDESEGECLHRSFMFNMYMYSFSKTSNIVQIKSELTFIC